MFGQSLDLFPSSEIIDVMDDNIHQLWESMTIYLCEVANWAVSKLKLSKTAKLSVNTMISYDNNKLAGDSGSERVVTVAA